MSVLLAQGWAHPRATSVARASRVVFGIGIGVIADEARGDEVSDPVMIRDVYHHQP
jgi:hypothetical protein